MSFKQLVKQVESSAEYKKFKKEHPKAILYSVFFTMRNAFGNLVVETQQADYWLGEDNVATFMFDENDKIKHKIDKIEAKDKKFTVLSHEIKFDVDDIAKIIQKEIEKNYGDESASKIIIVLQKIEGKQVWNVTCIIGFKILRLHIDMDGKVTKSSKESLMDIMKVEKNDKSKR
jgi:hypothetical protein